MLNDQTPQRNQNVGVVRPMIKPQMNQSQPRATQPAYRRTLYQNQQQANMPRPQQQVLLQQRPLVYEFTIIY